MAQIVLDASIALKWFVDEADSDKARSLLEGSADLLAPDTIELEVIAVLIRNRKALLSYGVTAEDAVEELAATGLRLFPFSLLVADAVKLAIAHHAAFYDCMYLSLAERVGASLITADARFVRAFKGTRHAEHLTLLSD
ncbi:MAG: type II toxin-antitoxin system VapC family toxin [Planctomycetes bacterium]|nr:type II toxin-antitoxin system VapC family toxin [Planctomycetota bacterium]NUQ35677.1 type II toxin-antitoxin system VapC family toxin [Planctomycetaceae bacterium]